MSHFKNWHVHDNFTKVTRDRNATKEKLTWVRRNNKLLASAAALSKSTRHKWDMLSFTSDQTVTPKFNANMTSQNFNKQNSLKGSRGCGAVVVARKLWLINIILLWFVLIACLRKHSAVTQPPLRKHWSHNETINSSIARHNGRQAEKDLIWIIPPMSCKE